jgi:hypothetical protein
MKRLNNCFDQIADYQNIRLAFLKALRGNRSSPGAVQFCQDLDRNLGTVRRKLLNPQAASLWGDYRSFLIRDPKLRVISTAPFEQRIMHHAIIAVLEAVLERPQICHSYACRKGKGTHAAVRYAFNQGKASPYFLKLDIRKYFDSIDHAVLETQLQRLIKDGRVLQLLRGIIDSYETAPGKGVPIGNLTSQYFANLYLAGMDHFILETLRPRAYCRYMDDFVLWASSLGELKTMRGRIDEYARGKLRLTCKQPVFGTSRVGLSFLGLLIKDRGIYLLQKSKRRASARMADITASLNRGEITEAKAAERARSVFASIALARSNRFRRGLVGKYEIEDE